MAADVAGYSRLMGEDEEGTLAALKAIRREFADPRIAEHRGRIVKTTGDGLLVEFPSVVDAVRCAVEIQREMALRNDGVAKKRRIEFRIMINLGDIMIDEHDIYGDGVNVAARLEALAEPGRDPWQVCVRLDCLRSKTGSVRQTHYERQRHIQSCDVRRPELTDPLPDPFPADRDRFVGHHLRSDPQPRLRPRLDRDAEIRLRQFGGHWADHDRGMVLRDRV
jgi:class 3 adenylate cyclase